MARILLCLMLISVVASSCDLSTGCPKDVDRDSGGFCIAGPVGTVITAKPTVSWEASRGADFYELKIGRDPACGEVVTYAAPLVETSYTLSDFEALVDGSYYVCISSFAGMEPLQKAANQGLRFNVDTTPSGAFSIENTPQQTETRRPQLNWQPSSDGVGYIVRLEPETGCDMAGPAHYARATIRTHLGVERDLPLGLYNVCIYAIDRGFHRTLATNSPYPLRITDQTPGEFVIVTPEEGSSVSAGELYISWSAATNASNYQVILASDAACSAALATTDVSATEAVFPFEETRRLHICIFAIAADGARTAAGNNGVAVEVLPKFMITAPIGAGTIPKPEITWEPLAGATRYRVAFGQEGCDTDLAEVVDTSLAVAELGGRGFANGSYHLCVTAVMADGAEVAAANDGVVFVVDPQRVFVTRESSCVESDVYFPGNRADWFPFIAGSLSMHSKCSMEALAAGLVAADTWDYNNEWSCQAIMTAPGSDFYQQPEHLAWRDTVITRPVFNTNGDLVATDLADMFDGTLAHPIRYDAFGDDVTLKEGAITRVWTGALVAFADGRVSDYGFAACGNFDSPGDPVPPAVGDLTATDRSWYHAGSGRCGCEPARIYCITPPY